MKATGRTNGMQIMTVNTQLGWMAAGGEEKILKFLTIGHQTQRTAIQAMVEHLEGEPILTDWHPELAALLAAYARGEAVDFSKVKIDLEHLTEFQHKIVQQCRRIARGKTLTYGELAERAGSPHAARAVGNVMARNRYPLIVPCHRVVASGGGLGGFSAPRGVSFKQELLEMESELAAVG